LNGHLDERLADGYTIPVLQDGLGDFPPVVMELVDAPQIHNLDDVAEFHSGVLGGHRGIGKPYGTVGIAPDQGHLAGDPKDAPLVGTAYYFQFNLKIGHSI
jgi:hypothetical protein